MYDETAPTTPFAPGMYCAAVLVTPRTALFAESPRPGLSYSSPLRLELGYAPGNSCPGVVEVLCVLWVAWTPGGTEGEDAAGAGSGRAKAAVVVDCAHSEAGVPVSVERVGGRPDIMVVTGWR